MKLISSPGYRKTKTENRKYAKRTLWVIVCSVFVAVTMIATSWMMFSRNNSGEALESDEPRCEAMSETMPQLDSTPDPISEQTPDPAPEPEPEQEPTLELYKDGIYPPDRDIVFEALLERNPDAIAWLSVPGTQIDLPVVRSRDNSDYLQRDLDGKYDTAGTLFTDMINNPDFTDRVTVIYGHNMRNGTMFADLHLFRDLEFFTEHREIKLYTTEGMRIYYIFATYITDDKNILYETNYSDDDVWEAYLKRIFNNENTRANLHPVDIGESDHILTLSTCIRGEDTNRLLIQGVMIKGAD